MTSSIVSVEIGRSTWQGPAEEAPGGADMAARIEVLEVEAKGMRALLRAGCDLLSIEAEGLRDGISVNGVMRPCPEDQATVEAIREMEDWIASVKATLCPPGPPPRQKEAAMSAPELKRCPVCNGRGYHLCDCWPGDCICGFGDEECEECRGEGVIDPTYEDLDDGCWDD